MEIRSLPVKLTPDELENRAAQLAQCVKDVAALDDDRKVAATGFRQRLKDKRQERQGLAEVVKSKTEYRAIEVERVEVSARNAVTWVRKDTGEIIAERPMTIEERQMSLLPEGEQPGEKDPDEEEEPAEGEEDTDPPLSAKRGRTRMLRGVDA